MDIKKLSYVFLTAVTIEAGFAETLANLCEFFLNTGNFLFLGLALENFSNEVLETIDVTCNKY